MKFFYQHLLTIIKFRLFLKKDIVCNIFENFNFRFDDEWFSKKSYIDIYFFMSGLIFDFTVKHKIYVGKYSIGLRDDINVSYDNCYFRKLISPFILSIIFRILL